MIELESMVQDIFDHRFESKKVIYIFIFAYIILTLILLCKVRILTHVVGLLCILLAIRAFTFRVQNYGPYGLGVLIMILVLVILSAVSIFDVRV